MLQPSTVYLNGQFMSNDRASISPDDRGFYFADGVYEVIKFYKNNPFCFEEHMSRLKNSLREIKIGFNDTEKFRSVCNALIEANQLKKAYSGVYIQITRGAAARTHRFPSGEIRPTVFARAFALPTFLKEMTSGVMVMSREDIRWLRCNIKSIALLPNTLLFEEVASQGAFECLLVRNGMVTEASHSNILAVKNGVVHTHPDGNLLLPGITKSAVLEMCHRLSVPVSEVPIKSSEIYDYDEWFLTGTGSEIIPVVKINDQLIGKGKPGTVTRLLQNEFFKITYEKLAGEKIILK
jgi:D-alanine transaminase